MGRLRGWRNIQPVLHCNRYKRLLDGENQNKERTPTDLVELSKICSSDVGGSSAISGSVELRSKRTTSSRTSEGSPCKRTNSSKLCRLYRKKKPDTSRQLIQDAFQELMSYSCGQCGHVQTLQAEELKSILGHAFRLAYAAHLQKAAGLHDYPCPESPPPSPGGCHPAPTTTNSSSSGSASEDTFYSGSHRKRGTRRPVALPRSSTATATTANKDTASLEIQSQCSSITTSAAAAACSSSSSPHDRLKCQDQCLTSSSGCINCSSANQSTCSMRAPAPLPDSSLDHQCSPDSENSNSPTELNSCHRLFDKPPLFKHVNTLSSCSEDSGLTNNLNAPATSSVAAGSLHSHSGSIGHNISSSSALESLLQSSSLADSHSLLQTHHRHHRTSLHSSTQSPLHSQSSVTSSQSSSTQVRPHSSSPTVHSSNQLSSPLHSSSTSHHTSPHHHTPSPQFTAHCPTPPPLPERTDSLTGPDEPHLRAAAWFQAGIPREIALEVLGHEPLGAFLVRESSSKPGCYALSLRVPNDFASTGIAHYLIVKSNRGYRIKGFTKEFPSLRMLITHHSVMPELLPVPLLLTRHNPAFQSEGQDHNEEDPDYSTLSEFRKMMADLNI